MKTRKTGKLKRIIINLIVDVFLLWIVCMFLYSTYYKISGLYKTDFLFKTKKTQIFCVKDDLMSPDINKGEIVCIKALSDYNNANEGDIVYIKESNNLKLSKIVRIVDNEGKKEYITKGNKNYYYNPENITIKNIKGKYAYKIDNGLILTSIKIAISNAFTIVISILIILALIILLKNKKRSLKREYKRRQMNSEMQNEIKNEKQE